tara:strand:+ start:107 stop:2341 length:2235 start_codon:yes stop_codon:yes gene_type:complete
MNKKDYLKIYKLLKEKASIIYRRKEENKNKHDNLMPYIIFYLILDMQSDHKNKEIRETRIYKYLYKINKKNESITILMKIKKFFNDKEKNLGKEDKDILKKEEILNVLNQLLLYNIYYKNYNLTKKEDIYLRRNIKNIDFNINYKDNDKYYTSLFNNFLNKKEFFIKNIKFSNLNIQINKNKEETEVPKAISISNNNKMNSYKNLDSIEFFNNCIEKNIYINNLKLNYFKNKKNEYLNDFTINDSEIHEILVEDKIINSNYEIKLKGYSKNFSFKVDKIINSNIKIKNKIIKEYDYQLKIQKLELKFKESKNVGIDLSDTNLPKYITINAEKRMSEFNEIDFSKSTIKDGSEGCVSIKNIKAKELSFELTKLNSSLFIDNINILNKLDLSETEINDGSNGFSIRNSKIKKAFLYKIKNKYNIELRRNIFDDLYLSSASLGFFKKNNQFENLEMSNNENCRFEIKECEITKLLTLNNIKFYGEIFEIKNNTEIKRIEMKNFNLLNKNNILLEDNNINSLTMEINNIENMNGLSFRGSIFKGGFNIENKKFYCVPDLTNIKYENEISLSELKVKITDREKDKDRLRKLKAISEENKDIESTLYFNALEMSLKKENKLMFLYSYFSDYGRSISRPFFAWLSTNFIFAFIYYAFLLWHSAYKSFYHSEIINIFSTLKFSFLNSVSFGQILRNPNKMFFEYFYNKPEGSFNLLVDMPWHHMLAIKFHILLSAVFIFLMLLGVRNRFRIK